MSTVISRRTLFLGAAAAGAGLLGACSSKSDESKPGAAATEKVSVLTGANFQGREAPLFVAKEKGWFSEAGLDVTVLPGRGTTENLKAMTGGSATFATLDVSAALIEYAKGIKNFRLTSVLHQRNLACFLALASSGIKTPSDLAGRKISYIPGGINYVLFKTYAKLANFDPSKVTWVNIGPPQNATMLAARQVDAISQFVPAVASVQGLAKQPVNVMPFSDYMIDLHGSAIGVTTELANTKPDLVRRFNTALLKALQYSIDHPEEAAQIYVNQKEAKGQPLQAAVGELKGMKGYVMGPVTNQPLGHFDVERLARNIAVLQAAGALPAGLSPSDVISPELVS